MSTTQDMTDVNKKYKYTTEAESIINKDWAAGSRKQLQSEELLIENDIPVIREVMISPAFVKMVDEPVVNAADHAIKTGKVTTIKVSCDANGRIRIYNDGPGVEICKHDEASARHGRDIYVVEMIFGMLHQGSNQVQDEDCIVGGTNGFGAKVSNSFSSEFIVETVDQDRGLYCVQKWSNNMEIREAPVIMPLTSKLLSAEKRKPHTLLSFMPDYSKFGYSQLTPENITLFNAIFKGRMAMVSAYLNYTGNHVKVYYNDELIKFTKIADIAKSMFANAMHPKTDKPVQIFSCVIGGPRPWEVVAAVTQNQNANLTNVNGIVVKSGKHINFIINRILDGVKEEMAKRLNSADVNVKVSDIAGNICLYLNTKIPKPDWTGQRKDVLDTDARKYSSYVLPPDFKKKLCSALADVLVVETIKKDKKKTKKADILDTDKIKDAEFAGKGKKALDCCLIFIEGDSAKNQVQDAMSSGWNGRQRFGLMSTGGVIINVRKNCEVKRIKKNSTSIKYVKMSAQLEKNAFFVAMLETTGLNPQYDYDPESPTYAKEMASLRYGYFSSLTDQDYDGKGQITGLIISLFDCLWPKLIAAGRLTWIYTPIIRAYPINGGKVIEFLTEAEAEHAELDTHKFILKRYKGIATHNEAESQFMFADLSNKMITYKGSGEPSQVLEAFYGNSSAPRKAIHSKPLKVFTKAEELDIVTRRVLDIDDMVLVETGAFQSDNIARKLDHIIDGQNQAGRKILDGIISIFGAKNKPHRVADLAALITKREDYHHGADGLADSIKHRGFIATGGRQLPFLDPDSMFGTRLKGGHDGGAPRYIFCQLNKRLVNLIFPPVDYNLLPFKYNPEPEYFVPIIPMAILESTQLPGTGWKIWTWARDVYHVIKNVRLMITFYGKNVPLHVMPPCRYAGSPYEWKGKFINYNNKDYSVGVYNYDRAENTVHITELPLMVWTQNYKNFLCKLQSKEKIKKFKDKSEKGCIHIEVKLLQTPEELEAHYGNSCFDVIEDLLKLYADMEHQLNFYDIDRKVKSVSSYEEVIKYWFPVRMDYYGRRVDREILLKKYKIIRTEQIIRYIKECDALGIYRKSREQINTILTEAQFVKISSALDDPGNTPTDALHKLIFEQGDYKYLLNIKDYDKSEESIVDLNNKLTKQQNELEQYTLYCDGVFKGANLWLDELNELEQVIKEGHRTKWKFSNHNKYKFQ